MKLSQLTAVILISMSVSAALNAVASYFGIIQMTELQQASFAIGALLLSILILILGKFFRF
jgi:hypothetical protein